MDKDTKKDKKEGELEEDALEEQKEATQPQKEEKVIIMKKGDYTVHVLIEEIKNCVEVKEDKLPFPIVKITCLGKSQRTQKMKLQCTDYTYNEHFYFDKTNLTAEMLDSEKIIIEAYDASNSKKEDYFGIHEFDFEYIYNRPDHALHNFWLALANPESKDISQVRGYLKLSISVLHENDPRIELEPKESSSTDCMVPAQIKMEYKQLSIYIFKGEELPDMDSLFFDKKINRECDGYIEVKYMGITRKTKVVEMKKEKIIWNEIVDIPVSVPAVSQKIVMIVKDKDKTSDDIVGSIELKIDDIIGAKNKYADLTYVNIYGSSLNKHGKIFDQMNYNAEIGSKWKGRILIKIEVKSVDSPVAKVRPIVDEAYLTEVYNKGCTKLWSVYFKLYSTYYLPDSKNYGVRIFMMEKSQYFPPREAKNKSIDWNTSGTLQCFTLTDDDEELPDLFIYLTDKKGEYNICFQRIKASVFHNNHDVMVIKLLPDPCVGKVSNMMLSGLVKIKICIVNKTKDPAIDPKEFSSDALPSSAPSSGPAQAPVDDIDEDDLEALVAREKQGEPIVEKKDPKDDLKKYTIVAIVYMSRNLIAADSDGTSDPFVVMTLGDQTKQTSVKSNTVNGIWNEKLTFEHVPFDLKETATWPIFLVNVIDYNKVLSNVPIGYNYIWLSESAHAFNDTTLVRPIWHDLFLPKSNKIQGQLMLSFYIFDEDTEHLAMIPKINYIPETTPYTCEINILGLRELKPLSVLPVKKAFIKFDMNSLNVTGRQEDSLQPIVTVPGDTGPNPTINTIIKFDAKLPKDEHFIPQLQCEVYDHLLSGMMNSLLGIFTIDVKKIIKKTNRQIDEDLKITKKKFGMFLTKGLITNKFLPFSGPQGGEKKEEGEVGKPKQAIPNFMMKAKPKEDNGPIDNPLSEDKGGLKSPLLESDDAKTDIAIDISNSINKKDTDEIKTEKPHQDEELIDTSVAPTNNLKIDNTIILDKAFLKQNEHNSQFFVVYPVFKNFTIPGYKEGGNEPGQKTQKDFVIEDEDKAPDPSQYFKVGYLIKAESNSKPEESKKHYRRIYREPLENVRALNFHPPFIKRKLKRGKFEDKANETGLFDAMKDLDSKIIMRYGAKGGKNIDAQSVSSATSGYSQEGFMGNNKDPNEKYYGKFKGLIRIAEKTKMEEYVNTVKKCQEKNGPLCPDFKNLNKYEEIRKKILAKKSVIVRIYILELNNLAKKDLLSESDPYIKLYLNNKEVVNEKKNHQDDQKNCKWYKYYDIPTEIPGGSTLTLQCWDYDDLMSDDLIGETVIDLEDRFFDSTWQDLQHKPIEVRPLIHPDLSGCQGEAYLWLEIFDADKRSETIPWCIQPEPITPLECRLVVWETENMENMDVEGTSDIYVIGYVDMKDKQSTDVHFRCQTGAGSFNWRMLLPINTPISGNVLTLQVYDNDLFSSDDYICGAKLNIKNLVTIPKILDVPIKFTREYYNNLTQAEKDLYGQIEFMAADEDIEGIKFWVQCYKNGKMGGRVLCSLEILPQWKADLTKVGKGRDEPNLDPYLPPPVGRFEFSLNPFKMLNQCVGPKFRRKMYCWICLCLLVVYLICFIPYVVMHITGDLVNPFS